MLFFSFFWHSKKYALFLENKIKITYSDKHANVQR